MPGYMSHYIFGKLEYKKLSQNEIKRAIKDNITVYNLGLQGPDIFFYYPAARFISKKNLGSIMHNSLTGKYIGTMIAYIVKMQDTRERNIAIAYLAGYLGHYSMDVVCHPYIYYKTDYESHNKFYHSRHVALETDIDYLLVKEYMKKNISRIHYGKIIRMTDEQCSVIAEMLVYACKVTYQDIRFDKRQAVFVIKNMARFINIINDKTGYRKMIVRYLSKIIKFFQKFNQIFINDEYQLIYEDPLNLQRLKWYNPWDNAMIQKNDSFYDLMESASVFYQENMKVILEVLKKGDNSLIESKIGNKSMLSGMELI